MRLFGSGGFVHFIVSVVRLHQCPQIEKEWANFPLGEKDGFVEQRLDMFVGAVE